MSSAEQPQVPGVERVPEAEAGVGLVRVNHGAYRCEECGEDPTWTVARRGDVVVTWSCTVHLSDICWVLQRDFERTELVVTWFTP